MLGENISGPVPVTADSLFEEASTNVGKEGGERHTSAVAQARGGGAPAEGGGKSYRRQLAVFPYEHPSPIATTFDVTFHLPDVRLVAHADHWDPATDATAPGAATGGGGGGGGGISGAVEVGEARSTLLTWRMLR